MPKPVIDYKKCTACGTCVEICSMQVFAKKAKKFVVEKPNECIGCKACEVQCPANAIKVIED